MYFKMVNDNWIAMRYYAIALSSFNDISVFFILESSRFLVEKGEYELARNIVNKTAKMKGSELKNKI